LKHAIEARIASLWFNINHRQKWKNFEMQHQHINAQDKKNVCQKFPHTHTPKKIQQNEIHKDYNQVSIFKFII